MTNDKLMPARTAEDVRGFVADLDALENEPVYFKLRGSVKKIEPLSFIQFCRFANDVGKSVELQKKPDISKDELMNFYYEMFHNICKDISKEDVLNMTEKQFTATISLIMDSVTGRIWGDEKKKMFVQLTDAPST
jgi:hypothetical protein